MGQQLALTQRPRVRAHALANPNEGHRILLRVAYALVYAITALWIAYLPLMNAEIMKQLNLVPQHLTSSPVIDHSHKGDRVAGIKFEDRWNTIGNNRASRAMRSVERNPIRLRSRIQPPRQDRQFQHTVHFIIS
jgi:hypothetical protein